MSFINGYGLLAVGTSEGNVHILKVCNGNNPAKSTNLSMGTNMIGMVNTPAVKGAPKSNPSSSSSYQARLIAEYHYSQAPVSHLCVDLLIKGFSQQTEQLNICRLSVGFTNGFIALLNLRPLLSEGLQESSTVFKQSFNPERQLRENFITEMAKKNFSSFTVGGDELRLLSG